jgi:Peptidase family M1 domain
MTVKFAPLKKLLALIFCLVAQQLHAQEYWQQKVDYKMSVTLNPNNNSLDAFARILYTNNSPDTLHFIWFHVWPNAYKNDKTAFSDQLLENGNTDFYFSDKDRRGYINRLDFRVDEQVLKTEDHPEHIDIIKVFLAEPLAPGGSVNISTPFHVQLPFNFSRGGYNGKTYQLTQWYPKPAVYDKNGWHPMPYLDQGEFYSEFGDYEVSITTPSKFTVAATGEPQTKPEQVFFLPPPVKKSKVKSQKSKIPVPEPFDWSKAPQKTLVYKQENIHDYAWFADTSFTLQMDTVQLPSGKTVNLQVYFHLDKMDTWEHAMKYLRNAIKYQSEWLGDYPYSYATVVDGEQGFNGGMEYPTITILTGIDDTKELDLTIFHEIGHNWFYGALATNERQSPWMDEGMNTFYEKRYEELMYPRAKRKGGLLALPGDPRIQELLFRNQASIKKDQPMTTSSDSLTAGNYSMIAYTKSSLWMRKLERDLGRETFDKAMREYYSTWKFKHPDRNDFEKTITESSGRDLDSTFELIDKKGIVPPEPVRPYKLVPLYRIEKTFEYKPIFLTPVVAYNTFNGIMPGIAIHNYSLPLPRLNFAFAPFYGIKSGKFNGWGRVAYQWYPDQYFSNIEASVIGATMNQKNYRDSANNLYSLAFGKIAPSLKFVFKERYERSTYHKVLQFKFVGIGEDQLNFSSDDNNATVVTEKKARYSVFQTRFLVENQRKLYPWKVDLLTESHKDFYKLNFTGNYFFNFRKKGGVNVRVYAGKFFYKGDKDISSSFETERFHLNMSGPKGYEDYTYSNPYIGRFDTEGFASQQIMIRDGAFKVRTDLLADKVGKTDDWLSAVNINMDVPDRFNPLSVLPIKIPLKLFMDVGTYSDVWKSDSDQAKFLYDGGIQVSLLNNLLNFYFPIVYSGVYSDYFKSTPGNNFFQRMSFSINIQDLSLKQLAQQFGR